MCRGKKQHETGGRFFFVFLGVVCQVKFLSFKKGCGCSFWRCLLNTRKMIEWDYFICMVFGLHKWKHHHHHDDDHHQSLLDNALENPTTKAWPSHPLDFFETFPGIFKVFQLQYTNANTNPNIPMFFFQIGKSRISTQKVFRLLQSFHFSMLRPEHHPRTCG